MVPPDPLVNAFAVIFEFESIFKYVAWSNSPVPCQSPPTKTFPPPVFPSAEIVALFTSISLAVISIVPPFPSLLSEFKVPEISVAPLEPALILILFAWMEPEFEINLITPFSETKPSALAFGSFTTSSTKLWAASALMVTIPFWVLMVPSFFAIAFNLDGATFTVKLLLSLIPKSTSSPATIVVAALVIMLPLLLTWGDIKATYCPWIKPWLTNDELEFALNW